jgi:valyl-tRNA synthetase
MELAKNFMYGEAEKKWYQHWLDKGYFFSTPDEREAYTIVIPPPNVTGVLHMGHCLNNSIQDILARHARMHGKNVCWVPGTDHASIATEAKVVAMLRERGIAKSSLSRQHFLQYAWEWKEKYGGIILQQLKKMGCSLDWQRVNFTMDEHYYNAVIGVFNDLYAKGLIYRGKRMINWDPKAKTALSDEEVIFKETNSNLYYVAYNIEGSDEKITIATVRPETILGDTAICVNPTDERYRHLKNKFAFVPLIKRRIPIIFDDYVDKEFGTGALKVTPAHDMNDYQLGLKHSLQVIDIMNDDGTFSNNAQLYAGQDRFTVRKQIVADLEIEGSLIKIEAYKNQVGFSERSDAVVEPRLSLQWWVKMQPLADKALEVVMNDKIKFIPPKFKNTYRHWMANIKDWCISRQLWWGHRIPAWYDNEGNFYVAKNIEDALQQAQLKNINIVAEDLKQDEDCLDTWFSSWLWPFEVFKGYSNPGNKEVNYYYPTDTLVTAPEIIFFWVARMVMAGLEYEKAIPFKQVYFTGIVRDKQGRKMSKSLGNSPDLLELIDKYGADAVRFGIMIASPAGNDLLFDDSSIEQGRNFTNKIWNALKLVKMWEAKLQPAGATLHNDFATQWFDSRLNEIRAEAEMLIKQFRLSEALKIIYSLVWDDFCSWYLEWVKPGFDQPVAEDIHNKTVEYFTQLMQLLHPFMPFITEEVYHALAQRNDDLCVKQWSSIKHPALAFLQTGNLLKQAITAMRDARNKAQIKPKEQIKIYIKTGNNSQYENITDLLAKQVNAVSVAFTNETISPSITVVSGKETFYLQTEQPLNTGNQKEDLLKEVEYLKGFLISVEKKLGNEKFMQNAKPEIIAVEKKKKEDAEAKIKLIESSLANM